MSICLPGPGPGQESGVESDWRPPHPLLDREWAGNVPLWGALSFTLLPTPTPRSRYCPGASLLSPCLLPVLSSLAPPLPINCQQMRTHFSAQNLPRLLSDLRTKPSSSPWPRRSGKVWPVLFWGSFQPKVPPLGCRCLFHLTVNPEWVDASTEKELKEVC